MADKKLLGTYLYELKPVIDTSAWRNAAGDIDKAIKSGSKISYDEWSGKKRAYSETIREIARVEKQLKTLDEMLNKTKDESVKASLVKLRGFASSKTTDELGKEIITPGTGLLGKLETLKEGERGEAAELALSSQMVSKSGTVAAGLTKFSSALTATVGAVTAFYSSMKKGIEAALEITNKAAAMSNKMNALGGFGDMGTRDMMARYGVSATQANAMNMALRQMGLSESDIGRMTEKQRKVYDSLIDHFQEGVDKIDPDKLQQYYDTMEEFQLAQAKWKMDLQNSVLRLFAESDAFKRLTGALTNFFKKTIEFLETPGVQWFFDVFISFLEGIVNAASDIIGVATTLLGGKSVTNNTSTKNNNSRNTYYIYGSDYSSNTELARSIALETASN